TTVDHAAAAADVLGYVGREPQGATAGDEILRVVQLVCSDGAPPTAGALAIKHGESGFHFGAAGGMPHFGIDQESVPVLHKDAAHIAELGFLALLPSQPSVRIRG